MLGIWLKCDVVRRTEKQVLLICRERLIRFPIIAVASFALNVCFYGYGILERSECAVVGHKINPKRRWLDV